MFEQVAPLAVVAVPVAFLWTALLIELTPGPNMTYLAILSLTEGRAAGLAAVAGVATGLLIIGWLAAFGLAAVISQSPALFELLRWGGVGYLLWLAYDIWRDGQGDADLNGRNGASRREYFRRGLITNLLNPKAGVFYVAVLPPFIDPGKGVLAQTLAMSGAYVTVATLVHGVIVLAAARARPLIEKTMTDGTFRLIMALAVAATALWLLWTTKPLG